MSKVELDTVNLLDTMLSKKDGFIIVVDKEYGNRIHHFSCRHVQKEQFIKKVIENKTMDIRFIWVDSAEEATGDLKADLCMNCIAPMRTFLF